MVKQVFQDAAKQARDLARQVGMEVLKVPGEVIREGAKSVGMEGGVVNRPSEVDRPGKQENVDQQLTAARARMSSFAQKRKQEWKQTEVQAGQQQQQRVGQIVEMQLGHTPEGKPIEEAQKEEEGKKGGVVGAIAGMFSGKKSRKMGGVGQAKKDSSGEFGKSHQ